MSPIKHRSQGRGFHGAADDQRKERFQPGVRGPEGYVPLTTTVIGFAFNAHSTATLTLTPHSTVSDFRMEPNG